MFSGWEDGIKGADGSTAARSWPPSLKVELHQQLLDRREHRSMDHPQVGLLQRIDIEQRQISKHRPGPRTMSRFSPKHLICLIAVAASILSADQITKARTASARSLSTTAKARRSSDPEDSCTSSGAGCPSRPMTSRRANSAVTAAVRSRSPETTHRRRIGHHGCDRQRSDLQSRRPKPAGAADHEVGCDGHTHHKTSRTLSSAPETTHAFRSSSDRVDGARKLDGFGGRRVNGFSLGIPVRL